MIEERGTVVSSRGDLVDVRTERRTACGGCGSSAGCGTALLDRLLGRRVVTLRARNPVGAAVGDQVVVGVSESGLLLASLAVYLVPILGLLMGGAMGQWFGQRGVQSGAEGLGPDLSALIGSLLGFVLALSWLRRYSARWARRPWLDPVVLRRVSGAGTLEGATPEVGHP